MSRYIAFDPNTEVIGAYVLSFTTNLNHTDMQDLVKKHGLDEIDPQGWYPQQPVLDLMSDIMDANNATTNLIAVGMAVAEQGYKLLPDHMRSMSLLEFFSTYEQIYPQRHRNGDVGYMKIEKIDDHHIKIHIKTAYPDDAFYGIFYGYARQFSKGKGFMVAFDETVQRRDEGGDETVIRVEFD